MRMSALVFNRAEGVCMEGTNAIEAGVALLRLGASSIAKAVIFALDIIIVALAEG